MTRYQTLQALATAATLSQCIITPVAAQTSQSPVALATAAQERRLDDVTVTATRGLQGDMNRLAATVSVITAEEIEQHNAKDIRDALRYEPGVEVRRSVYRVGGVTGSTATTGRGGNEGIGIRGLDGNRVMLLEDGVVLPRGFSQGTLSAGRGAYTDTDLYQRIEILRGPASSMYGSDGLTGVINFVTKDPSDFLHRTGNKFYVSLRPSYDSSDRSIGSAGTMAFASERVQGLLMLTARHGHESGNKGSNDVVGMYRTTPDPLTYRNRSALGKFVFNMDARNTLKFSAERVENTLHANSLSAVTPTITGYESSGNVGTTRLGASFEHEAPESAFMQKLRLHVYHRTSATHQYSLESGLTERNIVRPRNRDISYRDDLYGLSVHMERDAETGAMRHRLSYGVDASIASLRMTASGTGWNSCTGTQYCEYFPKTKYGVIGVFVQDDIRFDGLGIVPGIRYDAYEIRPQASAKYDSQALANGQPAKISKSSAVSPRLAIIYDIAPTFSPYVQYARGFRSPSPHEINSYFNNASQGYSQIANPDLKPETSDSYEIGWRGRLVTSRGTLKYSAAGFKGRYRNFIHSTRVSGTGTPANPIIFQFVNAAEASIQGIEARLDWRTGHGLSLRAGLAYARGTTATSGVQSPLDTVAPLSLAAGLRYESGQQWFVQSDLLYHANKRKQDMDDQSDLAPPSSFVVDLSTGYRLSSHVMLFAGIRNLFDRTYWSWTDIRGLSLKDSAGNRDAYTQPGRSFNMSMNIEY